MCCTSARIVARSAVDNRMPLVGAEALDDLHQPAAVEDRRVSALRFGDRRVLAVLSSLLLFPFLPIGFSSSQLRERVAVPLLGGRATAARGRPPATFAGCALEAWSSGFPNPTVAARQGKGSELPCATAASAAGPSARPGHPPSTRTRPRSSDAS